MTLQEALAAGFNQLDANPQLQQEALRDATYLLRHVLCISTASMIANHDRVLTPAEQAAYEGLLARRLTCEPVHYITGEREFYGLPLRVNRAVLIPRNATEVLVECVLGEFATLVCPPAAQPASHPTMRLKDPILPRSPAPFRIVDVGTGSGAIAIALAHHLPDAQVFALDLSPEALQVAASNAALNGLADHIRFLESDLLSAVSGESGFHAIVSNPPYVPSADREELHPQVRDFEPEISLYGGAAGLDVYLRLVPQARAALLPDGLLAMEIGYGQRMDILHLLAGWNDVRFVNDLEGTPRVVLARRP